MKSSQITLMVIGFILLALMATNPSIEDHRQALMDTVKERTNLQSDTESKNEWQKAGEAIGMAIGQGIVEKSVKRKNYILFSITTISFNKESKDIGFGILGNVFIRDNYKIEEKLSKESDSREIEISKKSVSLFKEAKNLFYVEKDYQKAESVLKESIISDQNNYESLILLSDLLSYKYYTQDYENALLYINKAIQIKPDVYYVYFKRGMINLDLGRHLDAINDFTTTININPNYTDAYYYRALIYGGERYGDDLKIIDKNKACDDINKAIAKGMRGIDHYKKAFCN